MSLVEGVDSKGNPFQSAQQCGDFRVTKHFSVRNKKSPAERPNGYVVQYVQKRTRVTHKCGSQWDKTTKEESKCEEGAGEATIESKEDIAKFTVGNTQYMTHSYLELFEIKDGESKTDDTFQNGAVVKYIWEEEDENNNNENNNGYEANANTPKKKVWQPIIEDSDASFFTKGNIMMLGINIFVQDPRLLTDFPWDKSNVTPANGLPYLVPTDDMLVVIFSMRISEPLVHAIEVTWDYPTSPKGNKTRVKVLSPKKGKSILIPDLIELGAKVNSSGIPTVLPPIYKYESRRLTRKARSMAALAASVRSTINFGTKSRAKTIRRNKN